MKQNILAFYKSGDEAYCGSSFKISLLIDCITSTVEEEIRTTKAGGYSEEEIWGILDATASGLSFLQQKG